MGHNIKKPGIIRAGFEYQDLVAIETLLEYYRDASKYQWVQVESSDKAFQAVDDVVACRPDGRFELTQVKFAVDPDNPDTALDWKWLLASKPKGKSLLQHWSASVGPHVSSGMLASAQLKTDRRPDAVFAKALLGSRVRYDKIPSTIRNRIIAQLGTAAAAKSFFDSFDFMHSQPVIEGLEEKLWSRISSDTDSAGWALFQKQVRAWSIQKNWPKPDGKIRYVHLRQAFSTDRARPLPQDFRIPDDYQVPDKPFAKAFSDNVCSRDGVTVLWAPPGRGKSTFLSKFKAGIDRKKFVCIRHHYFLSLDDRSEGRFHVQAIARSLEAQLDDAIPNLSIQRQSLGEMIEQAALRAATDGKRLIVIIDGLDHVWREGRDRENTEELFNALIPAVPNVHLVVGTQKIAEEHLPARLLGACPMHDWTELPLMNRSAVRGWVRSQYQAGRLNLFRWSHQSEAKALTAVADAFFDISAGLPLHLIYSFEAVARSGEEVTPDVVKALPACPSGDIRDYYATFLVRLSPRGKIILHVLAGLDFAPPPFALGSCLGNDDLSILGLAEINHLLDYRAVEVRPFHGSLYAFVRDDPAHNSIFIANSKPTLEWLQNEAPRYWREAWLWITQARRGDPTNLMKMPTREWAIDFISSGYPIDQLVTVLDHAEQAAFEAFDLATLAQHRLLKTRALNGPEFQTDEFPRLWHVAAALSADPFVREVLCADLKRLPAPLFPALVQLTDDGQRDALITEAIDELNGRIAESSASENVNADRQDELARAIVSVVASADDVSTKRVLKFALRAAHPDVIIAEAAQSARRSSISRFVFEAGTTFSGTQFDRELFTSLCVEGLAPSSKAPLKAAHHPAMRCLAIVKGDTIKGSTDGKNLSKLFPGADGPDDRFQTDIQRMLHTTFMSSLAAGLAGKPIENWTKIPSHAGGSWLAGAVRGFERLAVYISAEWRTNARWPNLADIFEHYTVTSDYGQGYDSQHRFIAVRLALINAAFDLVLIGRGLNAAYVIDASMIARARASAFWLDELWLDQLASRRVEVHDTSGLTEFLDVYGKALDEKVSEFNERTRTWTNIALVGLDHGEQTIASTALRKAVDCLIAYGWRKDPFANEILDALEMLIDAGDPDAPDTLLSLAGVYHDITEYTDGDGTNHARSGYYALFAKCFPERVAPLIDELIRESDWRYAENLYEELAKLPLRETPEGQELLSTYIMPDEYAAVQKAELEGTLETLSRKIGPNVAHPRKQERYSTSTSSSSTETPPEPPQPQNYKPGQLRDLLKERSRLHIYDSSRSPVTEWLAHWTENGKGVEALADLESIVAETRLHLEIESGLDVAAELAANLHGRTEAFNWYVRAHIVRYGWQTYFTSSAEAKARLDTIAKDYKPRWKEFIQRTSKPALDMRESRNGIVVPFTRLIYFYISLGEMGLAKAHAAVMVRSLTAELAQQPLTVPSWA